MSVFAMIGVGMYSMIVLSFGFWVGYEIGKGK
jgi:hypothetical protein